MTTTTEARTETEQRAFAFLRLNERPPKPRKRGVTEIRGPYYTPVDAGAHMLMIESEGITEQVREWRTDVVAQIVSELGLEQVMFEAADPDVFSWYVKNYGIDVNLFVDHSQIVQLECLRAGIWGTQDTWGRMLAYRD
jgi:phosphosulfolactate synthase (CoM biosynthesis protein A)